MAPAPISDEYEPLAEKVRSYGLLYNKRDSEYKDKPKQLRAWARIAMELDSDVDKVQTTWDSLKKLVYKRKSLFTEANKSGTDPDDPELVKAREGMEQISFCSWLLDFINLKKTESNLNLETTPTDIGMESEPEPSSSAVKKSAPKSKKRKSKDPESEDEMISLCRKKIQLLEQQEEDECSVFGQYVASELRSLDNASCVMVKHDINNIIFDYRKQMIQHLTSSSSTRPLSDSDTD